MALAGASGSIASRTSSGGSSEGYNREGMAGIVPSNVLIQNLLSFAPQTFIANFDHVNRLCGATDLALDVGRRGGLDVSVFKTVFYNICHEVNAWLQASTSDVSIFRSKTKSKRPSLRKGWQT